MSYKASLLAFPAEVSDKSILDELVMTVDNIESDVDFEAYALLEQRGPVKFASVMATGQRAGWGADRGILMDMFSYCDFAVAFLGHDDQRGIHLFDFRHAEAKRWCYLLSDAGRLGGDVDELTVEYPQKGFAPAELDRLNDLPESELDDAQYAALSDYDSAIDIGLRECFGWALGREYLELFHAEQVIELGKARRRIPRPEGLAPLFAYWPDDDDLQRAGIAARG